MNNPTSFSASLTRRRTPWAALVVGTVVGVIAAVVVLRLTTPEHHDVPEPAGTAVEIPGPAPTLPEGAEPIEVPADPADPLRAFTDCTSRYLTDNGYQEVAALQGDNGPEALRMISDAQKACGAIQPTG